MRAGSTLRSLGGLLAVMCFTVGLALPARASEVKFFRMDSRPGFLEGDFNGIAIGPFGGLHLADRAERVAAISEPFVLTAVKAPDGWIVGTGNSGWVLEVTPDGKVKKLFQTKEPEVFALWVDKDGTVYAGSSPHGKVYRYAKGSASVFFDPHQTYIWALTRAKDGRLLVGTGTEGRLYAVDGKGQGKVIFDSKDTHIRALEPLKDGSVLVGTAGDGLILRLEPSGKVRTLYDADEPEVDAFAVAPDGTCYAALVASEASNIQLLRAAASAAKKKNGGKGSGSDSESGDGSGKISAVVTTSGSLPIPGSRPSGFQGPRSEIVSIAPSGQVESIWRSKDETVFALLWSRNRLWVGTGLEGKLYSYTGHRMVLEQDVDERQIVALANGSPGPVFATTNAGALYRIVEQPRRKGVYTSPALDAGQVANFGTLDWEGTSTDDGSVAFSFRSGMSSDPDATWSDWSAPRQGNEVSLEDVPAGRYIQWRMTMKGNQHASPELTSVTLSYRQINVPPRIARLVAMGPGEVLVPANFNPQAQVFEPSHPTKGGIFTTLEPSDSEEGGRLKRLWKQGYRTLRWAATDDNDDTLVYRLEFRRQGDKKGSWFPMASDLKESYYSFDATVLPDGIYRFRLIASDAPDNPNGDALTASEVSPPVVVDHTPPRLVSVQTRDHELRVVVADALSPLRKAEVSIDAGHWKSAEVADGLLDDRRETLVIKIPARTHLLLLHLMDAAYNNATIDLSKDLP